jgi:glycosyltransferase involved in cell wall biosynthesis
MMGRDEEGYLPKTLPPLLQVADEVIFVDTGSRDRTPEIVQDLGCQFFFQSWNDDFSGPKNFAIEQASHRWILNVDCDELLQNPSAVKAWLDEFPDDDPVPAYLVGM